MSLSPSMGSQSNRYRQHALLLVVWLVACLVSAPASGKCRLRYPYKFVTQDVALDMGKVVVAPDLPVGSVIKQLSVAIEEKHDAVRCTLKGYGQGDYISARQTLVPGFANVYSTDVEGVGIRIYQSAGWLQGYYPFQTTNLPVGNNDISEGEFVVQLIKTDDNVGSGLISTNRQFTRYYFDRDRLRGKSAITSSFRGSGTTIVSPTCKVLAGSQNIAVDFGEVPSARFSGIGSTVENRDFSIELDCRGSNLTQFQSKIGVRLEAMQDSSNRAGVLQITPGANAASGIGIELRDMRTGDEQELNFNMPLTIGTSTAANGRMSLPLRARYVQTREGRVGAGVANGKATFTITYD